MGLLKRLKPSSSLPPSSREKRNEHHRRSRSRSRSISLVPLSEVTEASLEVWRSLPTQIRQDPSMVSFQQVDMEHSHARLQALGDEHSGSDIMQNSGVDEEDEEDDDDADSHKDEYITIKMTQKPGDKSESTSKEPKILHKSHSYVHHLPHNFGTNTPPNKHDEIIHEIEQPEYDDSGRKYAKIFGLFLAWLLTTAILTYKPEKHVQTKQLSIPINFAKPYILPHLPLNSKIKLTLEGAFLNDKFTNITENYLTVHLQSLTSTLDNNLVNIDESSVHNLSEPWFIPIVHPLLFDTAPMIKKQQLFEIGDQTLEKLQNNHGLLRLLIRSNVKSSFAINLHYDGSPVDRTVGVIYAAFVLIFLYALIIWEVVHRTFAAILASTIAVAILAALNDRPSMEEIMSWIDVETILLLFAMMILIAILTETGIFDYLAVYVFKITNGKIWPLIHCLCLVTTLISCFLDNVSTVLLMGPITIRLCEVMDLKPVPVLMAIVVHANIGGTTTPVGDPGNVIITSNHIISKSGVTFINFTLHMAIGVIIVVLTTNIHLRLLYKNLNDLRMHEPKEVKELRRNIRTWERAAGKLPPYSKDATIVRDTLFKKVKLLKHQLKKKMEKGTFPVEQYKSTLESLQKDYQIKNIPLLYKSGIAVLFIISLFFLESIPDFRRLSLGWAALIGVILLLIITDKDDMDAILDRIEWPTLLFFAAMFVLMEAVERMGLIAWIGHITESIILAVSEEYRLAVGIILILWVSAITSAFVDSIPVTAMMVKIVVALSENTSLGLPLQPLVWALAFGPCLGGNGTLIGASANVICAGIAEQHGYQFSFVEYFKLGFPIMIVSVLVTTGYLMVAHVLFAWH